MRPFTPSLCSSLAIATALLFPSAARAQAFLGEHAVVKGSATVEHATGDTPFLIPDTLITVNSPQAVINWDANGPITGGVQTFQNSGTTALFVNGRSVSDYAVLNRILPGGDGSARISINGLVKSLVGQDTGGTVYFYSPNGIIIGSQAQIDVGRLGLTTSDPWDGSSDNWLNGDQVSFRQAVGGSSVQVNSGALISALNEGSYVALVAPVISHAGSIAVNGQAALVAAEASTITFNPNGLFDIQVTVGSGGGGQKITSTGTITGPASTTSGEDASRETLDGHRIYLVAVPKNDAISMAISGGTLGFDVAGAANVEGNAIVLSAGHDVSGGFVQSDPAPAGAADASITLRSPQVTSALYARASDSIDLGVFTGTARYYSNVSLAARELVNVFADGDTAELQIDGSLTANVDRQGNADGENVTAGDITLLAQNGGKVSIGGASSLSALAYGGDSQTAGQDAGDATGGNIDVQTFNGGTIELAAGINLYATARGGDLRELGGTAGSGTGGNISIDNVGTSGSITVAGFTYAEAEGVGGGPWDCSECGGNGGDGTGGKVLIAGGAGEGHSTTLGDLYVDVEGRGGAPGAGVAGKGTGGTVTVNALGSNLDLGFTEIDADGVGGTVWFDGAGSANSGTGGTVNLLADGGSIDVSELIVHADGRGSDTFSGVDAGNGQGGTIGLEAKNGSLTVEGFLTLDAIGYAGRARYGGSAGDGTGGIIRLDSWGGAVLSVGDLADLDADGLLELGDGECTGCSGTGGAGTGGSVRIGDKFGGTNSIWFADDLRISASGYGSVGSSGDGGLGTGGTVYVTAQTGTRFEVDGALRIAARGEGGGQDSGGTAGAGVGGTAFVYSLELPVEGPGFRIGSNLRVDVGGLGGDAYNASGGTGGAGTGGNGNVIAQNGSFEILGNLTVDATGQGGDAWQGTGGTGTGKWALLGATLGGGATVFSTTLLDSSGLGGSGAVGGDGFGGSFPNGARLLTEIGGLGLLGAVNVRSRGVGGEGYQGGGDGTGGYALVSVANAVDEVEMNAGLTVDASGIGGGAPTVQFGQPSGVTAGGRGLGGQGIVSVKAGRLGAASITAKATGTGGDMASGFGGDGVGKFAIVEALNGGRILVSGNATSDVSGSGGDGLVGGVGQGGGEFNEEGFGIADGAHLFAKGGTLTVNGLGTVLSSGSGGNGTGGRGGRGGDGVGGWATIAAANSNFGTSSIQLNSAALRANGTGGAGGSGYNGFLLSTEVDGGDGGGGYGGRIAILASAGNGFVNAGSVEMEALGLAGDGGLGGGSFNEGVINELGDGGDGGFADGGFIEFGVESGSTEAANLATGRAVFGTVTADASATGGAGANTLTQPMAASGGNGGGAHSGAATLLVRGARVEVITGATMLANATGGEGGAGSGPGTSGLGGDAVLTAEGALGVVVTDRFLVGTRGLLTGGTITGSATAVAGSGGSSTSFGGSGLQVRNSDVDVDSLTLTVSAASEEETAVPDFISVSGGTAKFGSLALTTSGTSSLFVNNGLLDVGALTLSATDFVPDAAEPPAVVGLAKAQTADITTDNNFYTTANMQIGSDFTLVAPGSITIANLTGGGSLDLTAQGGFIQLGDVRSNGNTTLQASSSVTALDFDVDGFLSVTADNAFIQGNTVFASGLTFNASGDINTAAIDSGGIALLTSTDGAITTGDITAVATVEVDAEGNISVGNVTSDSQGVSLRSASGAIDGGNVSAGSRILATAPGAITLQDLSTVGSSSEIGYDINLDSGTSIEAGDINSQGGIHLASDGSIDVGSLAARLNLILLADGNVATGAITGTPNSNLLIGGAAMRDLAGSPDFLNSPAVLAGTLQATGGSVTIGGDVDVSGGVAASSGAAMSLQNVKAGGRLALQSGANMTTGNLQTGSFANIYSGGTLTTGNIQASGYVVALAQGNISVGGLSGGRLYLGGVSQAPSIGEVTDDNSDGIVGLPVQNAGSIAINGAVNGSTLVVAAGTTFTATANVTAGGIGIQAGGAAVIDGDWNGQAIFIRSGDIALGANASVTASDILQLTSTNAGGMLIGDGLTGSGYALSNAEFGRLDGGDIVIGSIGAQQSPDMVIGNLSVAGSQIGGEGTLAFFAQSEGSTIRVDGNVAATGFNLDQTVAFSSNRFELNTATGSVGIANGSGGLAGYLELFADQVWVADGAILGKLAANPLYVGREAELNAAAAVQRPEGVLRAYDITVYEPSQVLVQNTGTLAIPAGILAADGDIIGFEQELAAIGPLATGPIELIINGQIVTEGGTITGVPVWEAVVTDEEFTPELFTANSSINGCLLTATTCSQLVDPDPEPRPPVDPPRPDLTFGTEPPLVDKLFAREETACGGASPDALVAECALSDERLIEEPVTGSGNPALMGDTGDGQ